MSNSVELHDVTKTFEKTVAVDRLDLTIPEGSIYGFIGPNGSGKTTTLRLILRIFQPDSGRVVVLGNDRGSVADDRLGYLPEERGLYKRMKVFDLIAYFARLRGFFACREAVLDWLERLGAASWANRKVETLSRGMAQKVQFIVAVIARPRLLILDEPFAGLDPVNLELLKGVVLSLRGQGTTVVLSTHDMNTAETMCDTILMMFQGRKVLDGSLSAIQSEYPANQVRVRLVDDAPPLEGIEACMDRNRPYFEQYKSVETMTVEEVKVIDRFAYVRVNYKFQATPKGDGEPVEEDGKGIFLLKRKPDGSWVSTHCVWNFNTPASP